MWFSPTLCQGQLLGWGDVLVAEKDHAVIEQDIVNFREGIVVDFAQVRTAYFRTHRARQRDGFEGHSAASA